MPWADLLKIISQYQTLIAGTMAIFGGAFTIIAANKQIREMRTQNKIRNDAFLASMQIDLDLISERCDRVRNSIVIAFSAKNNGMDKYAEKSIPFLALGLPKFYEFPVQLGEISTIIPECDMKSVYKVYQKIVVIGNAVESIKENIGEFDLYAPAIMVLLNEIEESSNSLVQAIKIHRRKLNIPDPIHRPRAVENRAFFKRKESSPK